MYYGGPKTPAKATGSLCSLNYATKSKKNSTRTGQLNCLFHTSVNLVNRAGTQ